MLHYPIAILVITLLGKNTSATAYTFWQVFIPTAILTLVLSGILSLGRKAIKMINDEKGNA